MIEERFFEGKDLEEALNSAASTLGVPEADLHYEIVEQGRRGVLGFGARSVRIRIKPPLDEPVDSTELVGAVPAPPKPKRESPAKSKSPRTGSRHQGGGRGQSRRGQSKRGQSKRGQSRREGPRREKPRPDRPPVEVSPEQTAAVQKTVQQMLDMAGLEVSIEPGSADSGVSLRLDGPDRKLLMEKNAELLWALQFLLNRMARRTWPDAGRIHLACDGQTRKRDDDLVELVREVAQQVSSTGRTKKLQPMNAYERRLVHLTVREFAGLSSSSDGDGTMKQVRISKVQNQI